MITVVISSYKYGHLAAHCIESMLSQQKKPDKILFVDDGIGDCSYLEKIYPEVEYTFRKENLGTVNNFQDMLNKVDTEYCMFIGADNWLRSDTIYLFDCVIKEHNPDIITYDILLTGELKQTRVYHHRNEVHPHQGDMYWSRNAKHHGSMLYRTSLAKSVGGYSRYNTWAIHTQEDLNLWEKMTKAGAKVAYINEPLLNYRHHRENFNRY